MIGASNIMTGLRMVVAIAVLATPLVLPVQAMAASECDDAGSDPTAAQYCPPTETTPPPSESGTEAGSVESTGAGATSVSESEPTAAESEATSAAGGSLPFTGLDLVALIAVAGALGATGLVLHRLSGAGRTGVR